MPKYLQLIDFGSYSHSMLNQLPKYKQDIIAYLEYNLMSMLQGCLIQQLLPLNSTVQTIIVEDAFPYWRHGLLWELYKVTYKGNRTAQPQRQELVEGLRGKMQDIFKLWGINTLKLQASTIIANKIYGYEADDCIAGIIREIGGMYDGVFTLTVDSDYLPFTADPKVTWCCTGHHEPRIRNFDEALHWCKNAAQNRTPKYKLSYEWKSPAQLWDFKAQFGDSSDNINGNRKDKVIGRYEPFVDLFNPHSDFKCWNEHQFNRILDYVITPPLEAVSIFDYNSEHYHGQKVCIPPYKPNPTDFNNLLSA